MLAIGFEFDVAGLLVCIIAFEFFGDYCDWGFGEYCDAVIAFLCYGGGVVADGVKIFGGEVEAFEFLHHQNIEVRVLQVFQDMLFAGFDGVNVPRCDFHAVKRSLSCAASQDLFAGTAENFEDVFDDVLGDV